MRSLRYLALSLLVTLALSATPISRDDGQRAEHLMTRISQFFAHLVQPFSDSDGLIVPHP